MSPRKMGLLFHPTTPDAVVGIPLAAPALSGDRLNLGALPGRRQKSPV